MAKSCASGRDVGREFGSIHFLFGRRLEFFRDDVVNRLLVHQFCKVIFFNNFNNTDFHL